MSPGDLDARLRGALTGQPDPAAGLDTPAALDQVLRRSWRRTRVRHAVAVAAAAAVGVVAGALLVLLPQGEDAPEPAPQPRPGGTYQRTVGAGDWRGEWTITLGSGRVLELVAPRGVPADEAPTDGASYRLTDEVLTVDAFVNGVCDTLPPASYTWTLLDDGGLLLQSVDDTCAPRARLFSGLWRTAP